MLTKVTLPQTIKLGEAFTLDVEWVNQATGRALRNFTLREVPN